MGEEVPSIDELLDENGELGSFFCDLWTEAQLKGILAFYPRGYKQHDKLAAVLGWAKGRLSTLSAATAVAHAIPRMDDILAGVGQDDTHFLELFGKSELRGMLQHFPAANTERSELAGVLALVQAELDSCG